MAYNPTVWKENDIISAEKLNKLENGLAEISKIGGGSTVPAGMISIWSGLSTNIPDGWILCDGTNGTPDLRDKFVLGAGTSYAVGATGGEAEVILTTEQMPSHNHHEKLISTAGQGTYSNNPGEHANYRKISDDSIVSAGIGIVSTYSTGGSKSHNNMPPYYTLCYVMKI